MSENKEFPHGDSNGERRIEKRLLIHVQVEISGVDNAGHPFAEQTRVEDFSDIGCRFRTVIPLRPGSSIAIKTLGSNGQSLPQEEPKMFEIVWAARGMTGWMVGARAFPSQGISDRKADLLIPTPGDPTK